ncbi:UDP-glucose:glycoprotein glucosyltransferase 1 [Trichinella nativa]|uniref:UDP-glucose:glycoprotein glucosyltransferase 1 n=1 Tax=Trichinella nativa TaxID=6335 RepID=A0A0V1KSB2_9BILA|nr:UDP-glucose:glycoprotein glucosyltransferase 1 [Trichinella nativa]
MTVFCANFTVESLLEATVHSMWVFPLIVVCFVSPVLVSPRKAHKNVIVSVRSKWPSTSLIMEASEFMSKESNEKFWQFIEAVIDKHQNSLGNKTDREVYNGILQIGDQILKSKARLEFLKLALTVRVHSATVEMHRQIAATSLDVQNGKSVYAVVHGKQISDLQQLDTILKHAEALARPVTYEFDHIYPGSKQGSVCVLLYADIENPHFKPWHLQLKKLVQRDGISYILRHYPKMNDDMVALSGYAVELAIKSTEYKAVDDSDKQTGSESGVSSSEEEVTDLNGFNLHLLEADELTPLKVWQLQHLSFQAGQRVILAPKEEALRVLRDISQNFPIMARSLTRMSINPNFKNEVEENQADAFSKLNIEPGDSAFFIDGIVIDLEEKDIFNLIELLKNEEMLISGLLKLGIRRKDFTLLYAMKGNDPNAEYAVDYTQWSPQYINNLESDAAYRNWGNSIHAILQPYFPGMIRPIAKNFFTLIFVLRLGDRESQNLLSTAYQMYEHVLPIRIGFIFVVNNDKSVSGYDDAGVAMLNAFNFIKEDRSVSKAVMFLIKIYNTSMRETISVEDVHKLFKSSYRDENLKSVFNSEEYNQGRSSGVDFIKESGLSMVPMVLMNGYPFTAEEISPEHIEEAILSKVMRFTVDIQKDVYEGNLKENMDVQQHLLKKPTVLPKLNYNILQMENIFLDMTDTSKYGAMSVEKFSHLDSSGKTQFIIESILYLTKNDDDILRPVTLWIVADVESDDGQQFFLNAIKYLKYSVDMRIALIHNPKSEAQATKGTASLVQACIQFLPLYQSKAVIGKIFANKITTLEDLINLSPSGISWPEFKKAYNSMSDIWMQLHVHYAKFVLNLDPGVGAIVANGKVLAPLSASDFNSLKDFNFIERYLLTSGCNDIAQHLKIIPYLDKSPKALSDLVMRLYAFLRRYNANEKRHWPIIENYHHSCVQIEASDPTAAQFDIVAIVDPLSPAAQKMSHLLVILSSVLNVHMKVCMNCKSKLSEIPLKNFFRMVLPRELEFADDGSLKAQSSARFSALPQKQLFTLNIIAPQSWMVESVEAVYDLDNIKMEEFTLGTFHEPFMFDTIVMANLGYFQLKANPGAWILALREGKSAEIYEVKSVDGVVQNQTTSVVILDGFSGRMIHVKVAKKNDQLENELLAESEDAESESLWQSISKTFQSGEKYDVINIFSLASGHLYERFLRIMMLSVLKHTKTAVKFWLLKNYLSPGFKEFLPYMAGHYNFSYELVQYKWPRWLHQQTEKQRIMWGYKILFLDVLFPLDVKKIIFVDADQVVRTDMLNLMELDLEGAPYAYTPFCDSRKEMDGYRFWKQGYWENHLAGRKYHISALYVVDLKKFRQVAAGDRLRGQYHFLSRDPNSLSNLDQDLPNNMIHQVKIKSLPQEWLWCETWCDDKSKKFAKTIDLCNNPMTKEPKLQSAMRIIEEWKDYDSEIKDLLDQRTKDKWNITEQKIVDIGFQFTAYFLVFLEESWNRAMNKENQVQDNRKAEITRDDLPPATGSINNATEMKARQRGMIEKMLRKYVVRIKNQNSLIKLRIMPANSLGTLRLSNRRLSKFRLSRRVLESCFAGLKCFPAYYSDQKVKNDSVDCSRNSDKFKNYYRKHWDTDITVEDETVVGLKNRILKGDRSALASAITLVESNHPTKRAQGECLLQSMLKISKKRFDEHGPKSLIFRIAITGAPGAGKSTFIESFGLYLTRELKKKIAVLTIDPSSVRTGGSIMGDVARMNELSKEPNCYIRPSATAGTLGGVRRGTHESVVLCEGAGYDVVLIETVGVGQSESAVANIADMVVLLLSPALGDELQGIKRGIMEIADLILVTKADGDLLNQARLTRAEFSSALKYSRSRFHCWRPQVLLVSSRTNKGITEIWNEMEHFRNALSENGVLLQQRHQQMLRWMWNHIDHALSGLFRHHPDVVKMLPQLIREIQNDNVTPVTAGEKMEHFKKEHWKFRQEKNMLEIKVSKAAEKVYTDGFDLANASGSVNLKKNVRMSEENDLHEEEPERVPVSFADLRREQCEADNKIDPEFWRNRERMKTVSVALVLCLNIGIDPPDTVKPKPCARTECWIDPQCMPMQKALESIGTALQRQYQWWQPRARYKQALDPTVDDVRRLCISMRKNAKEERVLFHYNGHGVPRPTKNCEIWVFNKMFTQYIPLAIYDLQTWMGAPGVYVWDCNGAAQAIRAFKTCAKKQIQAYRCSLAARRKESTKTTVEFEPGVDLFQADDARQAELDCSRRRKTGLDCVSSKPLEVNFRSSSMVPDGPKIETNNKATAKDASKHLAGNSSGNNNVRNGQHKNDGNNDGNTNGNDEDDDDDGDYDDDGEDDFDDDDPRKPKFKHCIQLAACARDQTLPTDPALPADLFTCCLTTPIRMAVMYYILQNKLTDRYPVCIADRIPGSTGDRRSPLGELNWIFTAITDTIAWNLLPSETFQRLFRQDLLIASLYRNYLLADRVMRSYYCTPVSSPRLPPTHEHVMWQAWDMVVESVLEQLDVQALVAEVEANEATVMLPPGVPTAAGHGGAGVGAGASTAVAAAAMPGGGTATTGVSDAGSRAVGNDPTLTAGQQAQHDKVVASVDYKNSPFFSNQLIAFEVWLQYGFYQGSAPQQLPIVLQVLLSQVLRVRALELLARFVDLGPKAVEQALAVGIFPYILRLLQSVSRDMRPLLTFIWAKILAVDNSCRLMLLKDHVHRYFLVHLNDPTVEVRRKLFAVFALARLMADCRQFQEAALCNGFVATCSDLFSDCNDAPMRQWLALALGHLWTDYEAAKWQAIRCSLHQTLIGLLEDRLASVRAAAVFALGRLISTGGAGDKENKQNDGDQGNHCPNDEQSTNLAHSVAMSLVQHVCADSSATVRREALLGFFAFVRRFYPQFVTIAYEIDRELASSVPSRRHQHHELVSSYTVTTATVVGNNNNNNNNSNNHNHHNLSNGSSTSIASFSPQQQQRTRNFGISSSPVAANVDSSTLVKSTSLLFQPLLTAVSSSLNSSSNSMINIPLVRPSSRKSVSWLFGLARSSQEHQKADNSKQEQSSQETITVLSRREVRRHRSIGPAALVNVNNVYVSVWRAVLKFLYDPDIEVSRLAHRLFKYVDRSVQNLRLLSSVGHQDSVDSLPVRRRSTAGYFHSSPDNGTAGQHPSPRPKFSFSGTHDHHQQQLVNDGNGNSGGYESPMGASPIALCTYSAIYTNPRRPVFGDGPASESSVHSSEASPETRRHLAPEREIGTTAASILSPPVDSEPVMKTDYLSTCAQQFRSPMFYLLSESCAPSPAALNAQPRTTQRILPSFIADRISLIHQHSSIEWNLLSDKRKKYGKLWTYKNDFPATCMEFLPLEPLLCIGERDSVTVWNCNKGSVVAHFDNSSTSYTGQSGSDLSGNLVYLTFVNPYTHGFILTGTDCGEVRVWDVRLINEPDLTSKVPKGSIDFALLTAWMCADDARRFHTKPFTCYFWEQDPGLLFAAGDFRSIILWDAHTELKLAELKVGAGGDTYVCTLSADSNGHHLTAAGCSDGSVRLFDRRLPTSDSRIMTLRDLGRAVFKVHLEQASVGGGGGGGGRLVAASRSGQLCIWEPRMYREPVLFKDVGVRCRSSFDVHRYYPLIAAWNGAQVDLINFDGKSMGLFRPDVSNMTTTLGRLAALRFHPVQVSIGLAEQDGQFSLYGLRP